MENKIVHVFFLPPHSSHLTKPLDVKLFSGPKWANVREILTFIQAHITHNTKASLSLAYHAAYKASITPKNIVGGFRGSEIVPYDPQVVIDKLEIKEQTPTPTKSPFANAKP